MKTMMLPALALLVGLGALVHGSGVRRWDSLTPTPTITKALHDFAVRSGDYDSEIVPSDIEIKEKSLVTCRRYVSQSKNVGAMISFTSGPPGAVATHTPDVCYIGSGYRFLTPPKRETLELPGGPTVSYYVADFEKKTATSVDRQRVRWAWAVPGGVWQAPDRPRFAYIQESELYKLYVVTPLPELLEGEEASRESATDSPAVREFVETAFSSYSWELQNN